MYYTDLVSTCAIWAEPLGTTSNGALANDLAANTLPSLASGRLADDGGDFALGGEVDPALGDPFLRDWIYQIVSSAAYQSGTPRS